MAQQQTYEQILQQGWDNIPKEQRLPAGTWRLRATNGTFQMPKQEDQKLKALIFFEAIEPMDDVDDAALKELGPDYDLSTNQMTHTVWLEKPSDWNKLIAFMEVLGIEVKDYPNKIVAMKAVKGQEVLAMVKSEFYTDKNGQPGEKDVAYGFHKDGPTVH